MRWCADGVRRLDMRRHDITSRVEISYLIGTIERAASRQDGMSETVAALICSWLVIV